MRVLVLCDPPQGLVVDSDTTLAISGELARRGHDVRLCSPQELAVNGGRLMAGGMDAAGFDAVLVRVDPPVDAAYLHMTQLLELLGPGTVVVNEPAALRRCNEKLFILEFPELIPETLVSASDSELLRFADSLGGRAVVKPLDGCGGRGVVQIRSDDPGAAAVLELLTEEGSRLVMAQQLLPAAADGDKRIFLLDGEPIGALLRVPQPGEFRGNLHAGAEPARTELTARDREISRAVGARCRDLGLRFVGIDVIGAHLTEINVTSPTGFRELAHIGGPRLEEAFADWLALQSEHSPHQRSAGRQEVTS
jgi:glutathione synthase